MAQFLRTALAVQQRVREAISSNNSVDERAAAIRQAGNERAEELVEQAANDALQIRADAQRSSDELVADVNAEAAAAGQEVGVVLSELKGRHVYLVLQERGDFAGAIEIEKKWIPRDVGSTWIGEITAVGMFTDSQRLYIEFQERDGSGGINVTRIYLDKISAAITFGVGSFKRLLQTVLDHREEDADLIRQLNDLLDLDII